MEKKLNGHADPRKNGASKVEQDEAPMAGRGAGEAFAAEEEGEGGEGGDEGSIEVSATVEFRREPAPPPPRVIGELAESCVRYVERALGVPLDYTAETLPLLDHYLAEAEKTLVTASEEGKAAQVTLPLLVHTAGAYFGEVVRRRYPSWWRIEGDDPMTYRIEMEMAYLAFSPMLFIHEGLARNLTIGGDQDVFGAAQIEMDEEDQKAAAERLAELAVSDDEYYAPSTRLEALDVVVDTIRTRRLAEGEPVEMALTPEDYET